MPVPFSSFQRRADRLHQMAGQTGVLLIQARQRPGSLAWLSRLAQRAGRFHVLALDNRAAEIAERAGCEPVDASPLPPSHASVQRLAQRGNGRHIRRSGGQRLTARRWTRLHVQARYCWLLALLLCWGLVGSALWASEAVAAKPPASASRLVACTKPTLGADPQAPCPQPLPGGSPTTLLGTCPSAASTPGSQQVTQIASCTDLSIVANTSAFYGVLAFGLLCLLWWLWTVVKAAGVAGGIEPPAALSLVVKNFLIAAFAFLVAWSVQAEYGPLEAILLAAQHDAAVLPFHTVVFLANVALVFLIRVGLGFVLLKMLLHVLGGLGALAESSPRALALTTRNLTIMAVLAVVIVLAPWVLGVAAQILTSGS